MSTTRSPRRHSGVACFHSSGPAADCSRLQRGADLARTSGVPVRLNDRSIRQHHGGVAIGAEPRARQMRRHPPAAPVWAVLTLFVSVPVTAWWLIGDLSFRPDDPDSLFYMWRQPAI